MSIMDKNESMIIPEMTDDEILSYFSDDDLLEMWNMLNNKDDDFVGREMEIIHEKYSDLKAGNSVYSSSFVNGEIDLNMRSVNMFDQAIAA